MEQLEGKRRRKEAIQEQKKKQEGKRRNKKKEVGERDEGEGEGKESGYFYSGHWKVRLWKGIVHIPYVVSHLRQKNMRSIPEDLKKEMAYLTYDMNSRCTSIIQKTRSQSGSIL